MVEIIADICLDDIVFDKIKKGNILRKIEFDKTEEDTIHYKIRSMREIVKKFYELYSKKGTTKKDFMELIEKYGKKCNDDIGNFLEQLPKQDDDLIQVVKREETKDGRIILEFKKVSNKQRVELIKKITDKLFDKLTKKQMKTILQEGIRQNNDVSVLKRIWGKLKTNKPKIKDKLGCLTLVIDDLELLVIR